MKHRVVAAQRSGAVRRYLGAALLASTLFACSGADGEKQANGGAGDSDAGVESDAAAATTAKSLDGVWAVSTETEQLVRYAEGSTKPAETITLANSSPQHLEIVDGVAWYFNYVVKASGSEPVHWQDLRSGESGEIPLQEDSLLHGMIFADGSLWIVDEGVHVIWRINPKTKEVVGATTIGSDNDSLTLAASKTDIYVSKLFASDSLDRISMATNKIEASAVEADGAVGVAHGDGSAWLVSRFDGLLRRVNEKSLEVEKEIDIDADISRQQNTVALGAGSAWVVTGEGGTAQVICCEAAKPGLTRIDLKTNEIVAHVPLEKPTGLRTFGDKIWVTVLDAAMEIDPKTNMVKRKLDQKGLTDVVIAKTGGGTGTTAGRAKIAPETWSMKRESPPDED